MVPPTEPQPRAPGFADRAGPLDFSPSSDGPSPAARFLLPSVADLVFILLLLSFAWGPLARRLLGDGGTGWHIRTGQIILRTHTIPRTDPFSISTAGKPWYAWEWLYDTGLAVAFNRAGLNGVVLLAALLISATFALLFRMLLRRGTSIPLAIVLLLLAVSASTIHFFVRPHITSWLFTLAWFALLDCADSTGRASPLWCLPVLMLVWVNLHGGFVLGFVLLAIYLADAGREVLKAATEAERVSALSRIRTLVWVSALSAAATFVNPYSYRLHTHIYRYLTNRFLMDHIDEFLAPNFHGIAQKCFAAILLIAMVAMAASPWCPRLSEILVALFAAYSGLLASRNIPVASMLLVLAAGPMLSAAVPVAAQKQQIAAWLRSTLIREHRFAMRMSRLESGLRGHAWALAVTALCTWASLHDGRLGPRRFMDAQFAAARFPVAAVDYMLQHHILSPVFTPDAWGGYLVYRLYPESRVVVDDRHDLYGQAFFERYLNLVRVDPAWRDALESMHADWVLVPRTSALANILQVADGWSVVYEDETSILLQRKTATPAQPRQ